MSDLFRITVGFDADAPRASDGWIVREGKVFEAGDYPDKELTVTPDDLQAAVAAFEPVPVDLEHVPTLLDGKLGRLESVRIADDGKTLVGRVSLPRWLSDALGNEPVKVSTTWNRMTKKLMGLALVRHPRVSDAALMSAYMAAGSPPLQEQETDMNESRFKRFLRWLSGEGEEAAFALGDGGTTPVETTAPPADPPAATAPPPPPPAVDPEKEALRAALAQERASRIQAEAAAFADGEIAARRAYPAEREVIIAAYVQAAQEDITAPWPATLSVNGAANRVALLQAQYGARPAHELTTETVGGATVIPTSSNGDKPDAATMSEDRKQALLNMTHLGRAVAQKE